MMQWYIDRKISYISNGQMTSAMVFSSASFWQLCIIAQDLNFAQNSFSFIVYLPFPPQCSCMVHAVFVYHSFIDGAIFWVGLFWVVYHWMWSITVTTHIHTCSRSHDSADCEMSHTEMSGTSTLDVYHEDQVLLPFITGYGSSFFL